MSRHASLMPTFAALAIFVALLVGAQLYFGNFVTPAEHVGAAARQRLPADPRGRA